MKAMNLSGVLGLALALPQLAFASTSTWTVDPSHAAAQFSVKHMMISNVRGQFSNISGTLELNEKDISKSSVNVEIDASTVDTRNEKRDGHLKSPDFFDVGKYPKMTFKSTKVTKAGTGKLEVTGDLTIRGITKPVTLAVDGPTPEMKSPWGSTVRGFTATAKINRKDFGLSWNKALEAGGVVVGEQVTITIDLEVIKQEARKS